jgi:hypothetical protein
LLTFHDVFRKRIELILEQSRKYWNNKLNGYKGFTDTEEIEIKIEKSMHKRLMKDSTVKQLMDELDKLKKYL